MALTLEPNLRQPNMLYNNITIEDFMDIVDRVQPEDTPFYSMAAREMELGGTDFAWTVDSWPTPQGALGVADNENVASGSVRDVTLQQRKMGNIGQGFREPYGAGWIASRVPHVAGRGRGKLIEDAQADAYILLKEDIEVAFCSTDQTAIQDVGPLTGSLGSGLRKMIDKANQYASASAFGYGQPTDLHFAATAALVTGTLASVFNLASVRSVAKALRQTTQMNGDYVLLAGLDLREACTMLTDPLTVNATSGTGSVALAATQARVFNQQIADSEFGISIDVLRTDWGRMMIYPTRRIGTTTTNSTGGAVASSGDRSTRVFTETPKAGYICKKGMWAKRWGIPFETMPLPDSGGGPTFDAKCYVGLVVYNPQYFGAWILT